MADVDWGLYNPNTFDTGLKQGSDFVDKMVNLHAQAQAAQAYASGDYAGGANAYLRAGDIANAEKLRGLGAKRQAGQQYATGDYAGAGKTLAQSGDIAGAETLADKQAATFQKQHDYMGRAVPVLSAIYQKAGPDALSQGFEQLVPELQGIGTDPGQIDKLRQALKTNPDAALQAMSALAQKKFSFQKTGENSIAVFDENNPAAGPVYTFTGTPNAPSGYRADPNKAGALVAIPGGPGDPDVIKNNAVNRREVIVEHPIERAGGEPLVSVLGPDGVTPTYVPRSQAAGMQPYVRSAVVDPDAALDDDTARFMAEQAIAGDTSVLTNLGRGVQGAQNVVKLRKFIVQIAKERGMSGKDAAAAAAEFGGFKAGERTLGTRGAQINLAADEAETFANQALDASAAVPRTSFMPLNRLMAYSEDQVTDPKLKKLYVATQALINARARAISPTGIPRVEDQKEGRDLLTARGDSQESYRAAVEQMLQEVRGAKVAPANVRREMNADFTGTPAPTTPRAAAPRAAPPPANGGWGNFRVSP